MGLAPEQVDRMTLWQFLAVQDVWSEAHGGKKKGGQAVQYEDHDLRAMGIEGF